MTTFPEGREGWVFPGICHWICAILWPSPWKSVQVQLQLSLDFIVKRTKTMQIWDTPQSPVVGTKVADGLQDRKISGDFKRNTNHVCMGLNSDQALTPMGRDSGVVGGTAQKSSGPCAAAAKAAASCCSVKADHAHGFEKCGFTDSTPQERSSGGREVKKGS